MGVDLIMKASLVRKTLDNITVLMIAFENFETFINTRNKEFDTYKKEKLLTEELHIKKILNEGKDISSSALRVETENILNSNNPFNKTYKLKEENENLKNKGNKTKVNFKSTEVDFLKTQSSDPKGGSPKKNNLKGNKLPPVLYSENNFRESDNSNFKKSVYNNEDLKKNIYYDKLNMGGVPSKKVPIKVIKKDYDNENDSEDMFEQVEENAFGTTDFKSKYNHEKNRMKKNDDEKITMRRFNTEI